MTRFKVLLLVFVLSLLVPGPGWAALLTYHIVSYPADQSRHTLTGTIVTDGTMGSIGPVQIEAWQWAVTGGSGGSPHNFSATSTPTDGSTPAWGGAGGSLIATPTQILLASPQQDGTASFFLANLYAKVEPGSRSITWRREFTTGQYTAIDELAYTAWDTKLPSMGGTDPWVIAERTAIPEPTGLIIWGLGLLAVGVSLRRQHRLR